MEKSATGCLLCIVGSGGNSDTDPSGTAEMEGGGCLKFIYVSVTRPNLQVDVGGGCPWKSIVPVTRARVMAGERMAKYFVISRRGL